MGDGRKVYPFTTKLRCLRADSLEARRCVALGPESGARCTDPQRAWRLDHSHDKAHPKLELVDAVAVVAYAALHHLEGLFERESTL